MNALIAFTLAATCLLPACGPSKEVCQATTLDPTLAELPGIKELAGKNPVCGSSRTGMRVQVPEAGGGQWMKQAELAKATLTTAGWTVCSEKSIKGLEIYAMALRRGDDGVTVDVSASGDTGWKGTTLDVRVDRGDGTAEKRAFVLQMTCQHVDARK